MKLATWHGYLCLSEQADYGYGSNTCASGKQCVHYTQIVWKNSVRMGCAKVRCDNGQTFITCNYDPQANPSHNHFPCFHCSPKSPRQPTRLFGRSQPSTSSGWGGSFSVGRDVAAYAQDYANQRRGDCALEHSSGPYGVNIAWSSGDMSGVEAVNMWVNEQADYDYGSNTCASGKQCGHYTQIVWENSVRLGCAKVSCDNGQTFIACNYDPQVIPIFIIS
ncbi:hypothetical protein HID58_078617 [Brassica napus]|uniref:SCP domain-containing protein n=1 Tax=Brassica napus TaxID=3708 RepID=A0ABQ7YUJ5_BRANA|nr:hypothetical protein HID58_078617 [Brassica napus]